jgi:hypothetical protein
MRSLRKHTRISAKYNEQNEKFVEWFKEQPAGVQALANSFDPERGLSGTQAIQG